MTPRNGVPYDAPMTLGELLEARRKTRLLADMLHGQLESYLRVIAVVCRPARVLGDFVQGVGRIANPPGAERAFSELKAQFEAVRRTFGIEEELVRPISVVADRLELHPFETDVQTSGGPVLIVRAPFKWIVTYRAQCAPARVASMLRGEEERDPVALREFVLQACTLAMIVGKLPELGALIEGLRFRLQVETNPRFDVLPLVTVDSPVPSIRPPEALMVEAAELAGGRRFDEIVDLSRAQDIEDPLRRRIAELLQGPAA